MNHHIPRGSGLDESFDTRYIQFISRVIVMVEATLMLWDLVSRRIVRVVVVLVLIGQLSAIGM